jgi:hypothetical protein
MTSTNKTALFPGGTNSIGNETAFILSRKGIKLTILWQSIGLIFKVNSSLGAKLISNKSENGAETSIYLALSPKLNGVSGKYFSNSIAIKSSHLSYDKTIASRLWQTSHKMIAKQTLSGGLK